MAIKTNSGEQWATISTKVQTTNLKDKSYREISLAWRNSSVRKQEFQLLGDTILKCVKESFGFLLLQAA